MSSSTQYNSSVSREQSFKNIKVDTLSVRSLIPTSASGTLSISGVVAPVSAIAGAVTIKMDDSGTIYNVSQLGAGLIIILPQPYPGLKFTFVLADATANDVTFTIDGVTPIFVGTITDDTSTVTAAGDSLTFVGSNAVVGDSIELVGISTSTYYARAFTSAAAGITAT